MKILVVCEQFNTGGAETRILTFCRNMIMQGHTVFVSSSGGSLVEELNKLNILHYPIYFLEWRHCKVYTERLVSIITKERIDVVNVHPYASLIPGVLAAWLTGTPFTITLHGPTDFAQANWFHIPGNGFANEFVSAIMQMSATRLIVVSHEVKNHLLQLNNIDENKVIIIPNSIDHTIYQPKKPVKLIQSFLLASRLDPDKLTSISMGIQLFKYFRSNINANCTLNIAGTGQCLEKILGLINTINRLEGSKAIKYLGNQNRIWEIMSDYDVVIGMGRTVLEAGFCARIPVLCGYDGLKLVLSPDNITMLASANFSGRNVQSLPLNEIANSIITYPLDKLNHLRTYLINKFSAQFWIKQEEELLNELVKERNTLTSSKPTAKLILQLIDSLHSTTQLLIEERAKFPRLKRLLKIYRNKKEPNSTHPGHGIWAQRGIRHESRRNFQAGSDGYGRED